MPPDILDTLKKYCKDRGMINDYCKLLVDPQQKLFPSKWRTLSRKGEPVSARYIRTIVKSAASRAAKNGLIPACYIPTNIQTKSFYPHLLRHHFATHWFDRGLSEQSIADLMVTGRFR